ncbi:Bug family tripartite tricarboxylate transporter substrate binding protein [Ramlibacter tataouinensis]|uniref:Extracytoplasmic binding receptor-like protein n=1 Tax=Ramlibacter tataouinensis (strain ATCC BAA-407 / DSM 14655 / LMG 21543 / TTB310) TaxID=365046 RepID=F5Y1T1_RAMTT|nr:tripartite tricarboxylate transporter substrate binding protein [Ramlibacter tataouinensis]AEG92332.1 extracytoplasmic binding receptor-like protein [Ramlibacter tataouinensis TTB310]
MKKLLAHLALSLAALVGASAVAAADYPSRTIKIIVPFAPGGGSDVITRLMADKMAVDLGVPVIVDNKPGASSIIGTDAVARAAPDGYTILMTNSAITSNPWLFKLPFDTASLVPVTMIASAPQLLVAHPSAPFKTLKELVAYARANPDKASVGTAGAGQLSHLSAELLQRMSGTRLTTVHYKGSGQSQSDLLSGQIHMSFGTAPGFMQHIRNGKVVPLAVSGAERIEALPDVPTVGELLPGYDLTNWFGIFAPPGTPRPIVERLYQSVSRTLAHPDIGERLVKDGFKARSMAPAQFDKTVRDEMAYWQKFVKDNNLKID